MKALDILLFMLFSLLLANITILLWFYFLFLVVFHSFFIIPVEIENVRLNFVLTISPGAPIKVADDSVVMLPVVTDKASNDFSK